MSGFSRRSKGVGPGRREVGQHAHRRGQLGEHAGEAHARLPALARHVGAQLLPDRVGHDEQRQVGLLLDDERRPGPVALHDDGRGPRLARVDRLRAEAAAAAQHEDDGAQPAGAARASRQARRSSPKADAATRRVGLPSAAGTRGPIDGTAVKGVSAGEPVPLTRPLTPNTRVLDVAATVIAVALVPGDEIEP